MVRLLHYSDVENAYDDPGRIGRLAGAIGERRGEDALVLGTGDDTGPGALALATRGEQSLAFFEAIRPDAEVPGNHDFDYGPERTLELIEGSPQPWLAANVFADGERFGAGEGSSAGEGSDGDRFGRNERFGADRGVAASLVADCEGTSVGLVGVTDPNTKAMCPPANELTFEEPLAHVEREVAALDTDLIVVLSHAGGVDAKIARETDVDAVLGGHVHEERVEWIGDVPCTRPGANGKILLEVDLDERSVTRHEVADAPVDRSVAGAMRAAFDRAGLDEVVARVDEPIPRRREEKYAGECAVGNFVADAYRWAADADVGLQNSAGLRDGPPLAGDVTVADLVSLVPFDEPVAVAEVAGRELREILWQAEGARMPEIADAWHAQVSGATIRRGEEFSVRIDGEPLDPECTYTLATSDYLFHAPHEFPALRPEYCVERLAVQYEVLADYARRFGIDPSIEGRIRDA